jgi:HAE1 family hydrophobic/amphiphilic exporter-1
LFILSKLSLKNRAVVALITVIVAAFGFLSVGSLKQELIPSIEIPSAAIVTTYPGASPEVVDAQVSSVIENAVIGLEDLESTTATSTTGLSVLRVSFKFGTTTETAIERLNAAISSVEGQLPRDAQPRVLSGSFDSVPIIVLAVADLDGDNERIGATLAKVAPNLFRQVDGIRDVVVSGSKEKRINLDLDQRALAANGLTQQSITQALQANGLVLPVGSLVDENGSIAIQLGSAIETVAQIEALPLISQNPQPGSPVVTIADVANVSYEDAPITSISRVNGRESLAVAITKTPEGNSVAVSNGVQDLVPDLEAALGGNVSVVTTFDQAPFIEKSIKDLTVEGLLGLTFAVIVILVFLLSIKSTIITAISIPTSVLITFIGLQSANYSLNLLTLGALTISIGRVVDDSIVVIENINRHLSYGTTRKKAVLTAVKEVAGAITASTITTVAVFLPIALVDGLVGELFRPFAFTAGIALLASLLVSLTIVPVLAYWFLKMPKRLQVLKDENPKKFEKKQRIAEEEREKRGLLQRAYLPVLNGTRNHPFITLTAAVLLLGYTFSLVPLLKTNFIDGGGSNQFSARVEMPASTSLTEQDVAAKDVEAKIAEIPGVEVVQTTIGTAADGRVAFGARATGISINVIVSDDYEVSDIRAEVLRLDAPGEAAITVSTGGGFGSSETIDIRVLAADNELLTVAVAELIAGLEGIPNVSSVTSTLEADERVLEIIVDREKAAEYLLTETMVSGIVASQLRPQPLGQVRIEGTETPIYVEGQAVPETIQQVRAIQIPTFQGLVRLDSIASVEEILKPTSITSERGNRTARVSLAPEGDDLGAITAAITERFEAIDLPVGVEASIGGAAADQAESFEQLGLALLAAVAIVYIVMVATFGSLIQPLLLLISIPFAAIGALGLLILTDTALGVPALIGMLMLIGIVVTNAIVLIDLVNQYRRQGRSVEDSLVSGARQRLRPILMTALATIFALTPMAFGLTGDSGFISQPLAIVVIGGLVSSTLLTLILVPTLYWLVEGRKERKVIRLKRREQKALARAAKLEAKTQAKSAKSAATAPAVAAENTTASSPNVVTTVIEREPEVQVQEPEFDPTPEQLQAPEPEAAPPVEELPPQPEPHAQEIQETSSWSLADEIQPEPEVQPTQDAPYEPAVVDEVPPLAWSDEKEIQTAADIEIDDESSMRWSEEKPSQQPAAADPNAGLPEFLTQEIPLIQESAESKRDKKRREKAERKAQKKAAKDSRHAND